jgi:hypothetical protein
MPLPCQELLCNMLPGDPSQELLYIMPTGRHCRVLFCLIFAGGSYDKHYIFVLKEIFNPAKYNLVRHLAFKSNKMQFSPKICNLIRRSAI